jgi:hypothetical protein
MPCLTSINLYIAQAWHCCWTTNFHHGRVQQHLSIYGVGSRPRKGYCVKCACQARTHECNLTWCLKSSIPFT